MLATLPRPIAAFLRADPADTAIVADCFTPDAIVHDEGGDHAGHAAIRAWRAETATKYNFTAEPLAVTAAGGRTIVTCRVTGTFPGSPVELRYGFTLDGDLISALTIPG